MTTHKIAVALTLASGMVMCGFVAPARAADSHVDGYFTAGGQGWDQSAPEAKFQEFREIPRAGFLQDYLWSYWSGKNTLSLWGNHFGQTDQINRLMLANGVRWRFDLGYQQIPHTFSLIARTPYFQSTPGTWSLPDTLQARNQANAAGYTARMNDLLNTAANIPLGFRTDVTSARLRSRPSQDWQVEAKGVMRQRSGQKSYAMTFGFSTAMEIPEPIRQRMVDGDLLANYQKKAFKMSVDAGVSTFENSVSTLTVDNPKRITDVNGGDGPKQGVLDLYPDNHVIRGTVAMSYMLPKRSTLTGTFGVSEGTQDDKFLNPTSNKALPQSSADSLPTNNGVLTRSLNAKMDQFNADVRLASRPADKLDGALRFHYVKNDNKTDPLQFTGFAPYDVSWEKRIYTESDVPGNTQMVGGADADYSLTSKVKVGATAEYRIRERTFREVEKDKESVLGARLRMHPMSALQFDARFTHGDRKLDSFNSEDYIDYVTRLAVPVTGVYDSLAQVEQANLRRYDVANRVQDKATAGLGYMMGENLDLGASYYYQNNDYKDSQLGLTSSKEQNIVMTGTYHASDRVDLNGAYGYDWMENLQNSRESNSATLSSNPINNWTADVSDNDVYVQAGANWAVRPEKWTLLGNYTFSRHQTKYDLSNGANTAQDLPNTLYRLHQLQIEARYQLRKRTTVAARYGWEKYTTDDWATNNVPLLWPQTGAATAIFLGDSSQGYIANLVAVVVTHSF
jgi:MtrB/PioB family decaheme-associated outer membrane protein